jgi:predicted O-methyltransferase YrrM
MRAKVGDSAPQGRRVRLATMLAEKVRPGRYLRLDYPTATNNSPRWGHGRPPHRLMADLLGRHDDRYAEELSRLMEYREELEAIPALSSDPLQPYWANGFTFGLDAPSLYSFLRRRNPESYVEIGSGFSTLFAHRARQDGDLRTRFTSIDPAPRHAVDLICDTRVRTGLQDADQDLFSRLQPGDVVFFDGTHRVFMNSDATVFFLEILPRIPDGVLVGIHDVHLPDDYLPSQRDQYFSEQYLLAAYLLAECGWMQPVLPCWYVQSQPRLGETVAPLFSRAPLAGLDPAGRIFWLEISRGGA